MRLRQSAASLMKLDQGVETVIGLDVSLRATGICVASGHSRGRMFEGVLADTALIDIGKKLTGPERLYQATQVALNWLKARGALKPGKVCVMEGYAFSMTNAQQLGEIGGCLRMSLWQRGVNLIVLPPSTLKKYATGKGVGEKNLIMKHVYKRWGFDAKDDNQCDAFVCAMVGLAEASRVRGEVVTTIENEILLTKVMRHAGQGQALGFEPGGNKSAVSRRGRRSRVDV